MPLIRNNPNDGGRPRINPLKPAQSVQPMRPVSPAQPARQQPGQRPAQRPAQGSVGRPMQSAAQSGPAGRPQQRPMAPKLAGQAGGVDGRGGGSRAGGQGANRAGGQGGGNRGAGGGNRGGGRGRRQQQQLPHHTDLLPDVNAMPVNKSEFHGLGGEQQTRRASKAPMAAPAAGQPTAAPTAAASPATGQPAAVPRRANYAERQPTVRVVLLGGLGEIGKNMMALECGNDIIIIDIGFAFPGDRQPGVDYIIPDVTYLEQNRHKVRGIIVTHGHMDHIGAAGYMLPKFSVPVYGSKLTLGMVAKQIDEFKIAKPNFVTLNPDNYERVQLGESFSVELVRVSHTIADATAVVVRTPAGVVINTGDWKLDQTPMDNRPTDMKRFTQLGDEGVLLLMSDSTNCTNMGFTPTERVIIPTLDDLFGRAGGRIIISSFSSSISRAQQIIDATIKSGRRLALVGRSVLSTIDVCVRLGYLRMPPGLFVRVQDVNTLPDDQIVVLCTGSQGEENSALVRMSSGDHPQLKIKPGDSVILSSSIIPGNEESVFELIDNLMREGAMVFARSTEQLYAHGPLHVSGHANRGDTAELIKAVRPKYYMPIHGEFHHLVYNAGVAVECGMRKENIFVMDNGDVLELTSTSARRGQRVPAGMVMVDGGGVGDVEGMVLRDRLAMAGDGVFMIVATVSRKTGKLVSSPDIISRGFILMKEHEELVNQARAEVRRLFERRIVGGAGGAQPGDWSKFKLKLRDDISDLLYTRTKRNPMVLPVINEV